MARIVAMSDAAKTYGLTGQLLIAMPGMGDPRFEKSVVFLCDHSDKGAMGLIVNKPLNEVRFSELVEQLGVDTRGTVPELPIHFGGPVEGGRGFVLHSADYVQNDSTLRVNGSFGMTATLDVVQDIATGRGPARSIFALGYAGWGPGQLESEIRQNGWLTADAGTEIVFSPDNGGKWAAALKTLGVEALSLSGASGRA
jgi:putative transcriptional regulator